MNAATTRIIALAIGGVGAQLLVILHLLFVLFLLFELALFLVGGRGLFGLDFTVGLLCCPVGGLGLLQHSGLGLLVEGPLLLLLIFFLVKFHQPQLHLGGRHVFELIHVLFGVAWFAVLRRGAVFLQPGPRTQHVRTVPDGGLLGGHGGLVCRRRRRSGRRSGFSGLRVASAGRHEARHGEDNHSADELALRSIHGKKTSGETCAHTHIGCGQPFHNSSLLGVRRPASRGRCKGA